MTENYFSGKCLCGTIHFEVNYEQILFDGFCHCGICRKFHSSPSMHFIIINKGNFKLTKGENDINYYSTSNKLKRFFCLNCGTRVYNENSSFKTVSLFPALLDKYENNPSAHIYYKYKYSRR